MTLGTAEPGDVDPATAVDIWGGIPGRRSAIGHIAALHDADTDDESFTVSFGDLPEGVIAGSPDACSVTIKEHWPVTLAVTDLTAVTDDDSVDLFWIPVSGASGYEFRMRLRDQGWDRGWLGTGWVGANWRRDGTKIRAFVDTPHADRWYFQVRGTSGTGKGPASNEAANSFGNYAETLPAPAGVTVDAHNVPDNHVRISWNTIQGADAYWYQYKSAYVDHWGEYGWHHIHGGHTNNVVIDLWSGYTSDFRVRADQHRRGRSHYSPPSDPYRFTVP